MKATKIKASKNGGPKHTLVTNGEEIVGRVFIDDKKAHQKHVDALLAKEPAIVE